jgi:hypothetical protein
VGINPGDYSTAKAARIPSRCLIFCRQDLFLFIKYIKNFFHLRSNPKFNSFFPHDIDFYDKEERDEIYHLEKRNLRERCVKVSLLIAKTDFRIHYI